MAFQFNLNLSVSLARLSHNGGLTRMGKWAKEYFEKLKQQEGKDFDRKQTNAIERQQIMAKAPGIWDEVVGQLKEEVEDFQAMRPGHLTIKDELAGTQPRITVSTPYRHLQLTFKSDVPQVSYTVWEPQSTGPSIEIAKGEFIFQVRDQEVWLFGRSGYVGLQSFLAVSDAVAALLQKLASTA